MTAPLLSALWYRVADLRPRLRPQAQLVRHRYRGTVWFVVRDPASGRSHRFTPAARLLINAMDGRRTATELWELGNRRLGEGAPTQDELIGLLGQLHAADLLQADVTPDVAELFQRGQSQSRQRRRQAYGNPMSIRVPLLDPDRWLARAVPWVAPLWNRWGAIAWLAWVLPAALLAWLHRQELGANVADRVFAAHNLAMLWLLFPAIKVLHELGHGIATKMRGGEVHDMGLMLLVFLPIPYCEASSAAAFRSKVDRAVVGAAGMGVELVLAAAAMYLWLLAEPGLLRAVCFNVMLVAGVSTLVFNGNPLLRYDAYYILSDLVEIPNLASRANRDVGHLAERFLFGARDAEPPQATPGERAWFVVYAVASFGYRMLVTVAIVFFIAGQFFVVGVLLAAWAATMMVLLPLAKTVAHLARSPRLARVRGRVGAVAGGGLVLLLLVVCLLPVPYRTQTEGVVWLPEQAIVRAGGNGFLARFVAAPGSMVRRGDALAIAVDPLLDAQVAVATARVQELQASYDAQLVDDRVEAELVRQQLEREEAALEALRSRAARLVATAGADGAFTVPQSADLAGRFHRHGDLLGYVIDRSRPLVRVVVRQGDIDLVRHSTRRVELRTADRPDIAITGTIVREVPGGIAQLPSRALATEGGGAVPVDPRDAQGTRALERSFQLDIALPASDRLPLYGGRVHVRFEHPAAPLAVQGWRALRRVFLGRFHV